MNVVSSRRVDLRDIAMSAKPLSERLAQFRQNFKQILGPKRQGYGELSQLEQPLVGSGNEDSRPERNNIYFRQHGVHLPGADQTGAGGAYTGQGPVPSQSEELQLLCSLGREAAEILWEMAAYQKDVHHEADGSTTEMLEKGELLKAQLRGMIGDYKGGDETVLASALEVFDLLSNTMAEYETSMSPKAAGAAEPVSDARAGAVNSRINPPSYQQNPFQPSSAGGPTAPGKKPDEEAPLISFD